MLCTARLPAASAVGPWSTTIKPSTASPHGARSRCAASSASSTRSPPRTTLSSERCAEAPRRPEPRGMPPDAAWEPSRYSLLNQTGIGWVNVQPLCRLARGCRMRIEALYTSQLHLWGLCFLPVKWGKRTYLPHAPGVRGKGSLVSACLEHGACSVSCDTHVPGWGLPAAARWLCARVFCVGVGVTALPSVRVGDWI